MKNIIEIKNLNRSFGKLKAVSELSFNVKEGELFAFLGVNGAGKSTTINIMCGMLKKNSGNIVIDGCDIDTSLNDIKGKLGVVFQNSVLDKALSVKDNLVCRAALYRIFGEKLEERIAFLAKMLDFEDIIDRPVGKLSGGQRRRIDIARALIHSPKILILDEPTTGLDPQTRKLLWKVISDIRRNDKVTVFLTTHYMEEAGEADYVVILDSGSIAAEGTPLELKNKYAKDYITVYSVSEETVRTLGREYERYNDSFRILVNNTKEALELIRKHPEVFTDIEISKGKMDDVFLAVTGKALTEGDKK